LHGGWKGPPDEGVATAIKWRFQEMIMLRNLGIEYPARGEVRLVDLGDPGQPGDREILIGTEYSGITNGTERHALLGEHGWKGNFPSRHGYQHVGFVRAAGRDVEEFAEGDRVFYGQYVGHRGWHMQEVKPPDENSYISHLVFPLPDGIKSEHAALLGVAGVAMRGVRRVRIGVNDSVWVAGAGPIGQFAAQAARVMGAEVTVTEPVATRRAVAESLGASRVLDPTGEGSMASLKDGGPYDCIVDACGARGLLQDIHRWGLLGHGGVIGLLAVRSETTFTWGMLHNTEASIEVSCHFSLADLQLLAQKMLGGEIRVEPLITHRASILEAGKIYSLLRDRPSELLGVVFDWK
jgi:2-desacetyl-2-hydroxyethyl bacteriochlorophyllide A dehydrogenase